MEVKLVNDGERKTPESVEGGMYMNTVVDLTIVTNVVILLSCERKERGEID